MLGKIVGVGIYQSKRKKGRLIPEVARPLSARRPAADRRDGRVASASCFGVVRRCGNACPLPLPPSPATLSRFRESGIPSGTALAADSPRPVRARTKTPVPRPWGFGGAPRGTAVPLSSGRGVQATSADAFRGQPPQAALRPRWDRSPAKFLWYRQRHLSFQRKVGLRESSL